MNNDYSQDQLLEAVRSNIVSFDDFIADLREHEPDQRLYTFIERLLLTIYIYHLEGKSISRTEACDLIPAGHIDTCRKYVAEAERLGFVSFQNDPCDRRRRNVVPTPELIAYVEERARASLDIASAILQRKPAQRRRGGEG